MLYKRVTTEIATGEYNMGTKNSSGITILTYPLHIVEGLKSSEGENVKKLYKQSSYSSDKNSEEKALMDPASMPSSI